MSWLPQVFHWQSFTGVCDLHINNTALGSSFSCSLFLSPESSPRSELCSVLGGLAICWARMDQSHSPASSLLLFHLSLFFFIFFSFFFSFLLLSLFLLPLLFPFLLFFFFLLYPTFIQGMGVALFPAVHAASNWALSPLPRQVPFLGMIPEPHTEDLF